MFVRATAAVGGRATAPGSGTGPSARPLQGGALVSARLSNADLGKGRFHLGGVRPERLQANLTAVVLFNRTTGVPVRMIAGLEIHELELVLPVDLAVVLEEKRDALRQGRVDADII